MTTTIAWRGDAEQAASREQLRSEIGSVLKALADIDARCRTDRENLEKWIGPERAKKCSTWTAGHQRYERQALVLRLADLHERMTELDMLGALRGGAAENAPNPLPAPSALGTA